MSIVKCPNGHFYDNAKTKECPHCLVLGDGSVAAGGWQGPSSAVSRSILNNEVTVAKNVIDSRENAPTVNAYPKPDDQERTENAERTVSSISRNARQDPVTGWLVCVEGVEKGRDYRLHAGRNFVGRSYKSDVAITDDPAVARENHLSVVYDAKKENFLVAPGNGELTRLNGTDVATPLPLNDGDRLDIGACGFVFVAFCKGARKW